MDDFEDELSRFSKEISETEKSHDVPMPTPVTAPVEPTIKPMARPVPPPIFKANSDVTRPSSHPTNGAPGVNGGNGASWHVPGSSVIRAPLPAFPIKPFQPQPAKDSQQSVYSSGPVRCMVPKNVEAAQRKAANLGPYTQSITTEVMLKTMANDLEKIANKVKPVTKPVVVENRTLAPASAKAGSSNTAPKKEKKQKKFMRTAAGETWEDSTLGEWDQDDFRIFVGDLGNEVMDDTLVRAFNKYPSFVKARVIRDKKSQKTKGYGFASFSDPVDFARAMREMNGRYVGNRPVKLKKSCWRERQTDCVRKKEREKKKLGFR